MDEHIKGVLCAMSLEFFIGDDSGHGSAGGDERERVKEESERTNEMLDNYNL